MDKKQNEIVLKEAMKKQTKETMVLKKTILGNNQKQVITIENGQTNK